MYSVASIQYWYRRTRLAFLVHVFILILPVSLIVLPLPSLATIPSTSDSSIQPSCCQNRDAVDTHNAQRYAHHKMSETQRPRSASSATGKSTPRDSEVPIDHHSSWRAQAACPPGPHSGTRKVPTVALRLACAELPREAWRDRTPRNHLYACLPIYLGSRRLLGCWLLHCICAIYTSLPTDV